MRVHKQRRDRLTGCTMLQLSVKHNVSELKWYFTHKHATILRP